MMMESACPQAPRHPILWLVGPVILLTILLAIALTYRRDVPATPDVDHIRIVEGTDRSAGAPPVPSSGASPIAAAPSPTYPSAKTFGEPPVAADPLLDDAIRQAPAEIGVRARLFAMQWPVGRDAAAESDWQARLASSSAGQGRPIRVRCSSTTCEIATDDAAVAARIADVVALARGGEATACPQAAGQADPVWAQGRVGVAYIARLWC
jgi:hypothetical protein